MPRVFRQQYTRPIPPDAERIVHKGKPAARFKGTDGKPIVAFLTRSGDRCRVVSPTWYGRVPGAAKPVPLCAIKTAAEMMLAEMVRKAAFARAGVTDPFEEHRRRPLSEHLDDFHRELNARGNAPRYVELVISRLRSLMAGCRFVFIADLSASRAMDWLAQLRKNVRPRVDLPVGQEWFTPKQAATLLEIKIGSVATAVRRHGLAAEGAGKARRFPRETVEALQERFAKGASIQTTNDYLSALKSFGRWLVKDKRTGDNPFEHLSGGNARVDRRHDRRELTADELRRLLTATRASKRIYRGMSGEDRFHLYALACGSGYRASGLASLTPGSFDLDGNTPTVTLSARRNKSRVQKVQPLPTDVAGLLRDYLRDKPNGQPVWDGTWARDRKGAEMLRLDLDAAGIPYVVEGPDGPLFADFHALRHTYLTLGGRAGIDLRTLQELAGHSTPTLTARYSHRRLYDLAGAVERLPNFLPAEVDAAVHVLRATGTDASEPSAAARATGSDASATAYGAYTVLTQALDSGCDSLRAIENPSTKGKGAQGKTKPLVIQGAESGCDPLTSIDSRAGDGARTHDSHVGKVSVYRKIPEKQGFPMHTCTKEYPNSTPLFTPNLVLPLSC
jgi:integrase/recombinase XerC